MRLKRRKRRSYWEAGKEKFQLFQPYDLFTENPVFSFSAYHKLLREMLSKFFIERDAIEEKILDFSVQTTVM